MAQILQPNQGWGTLLGKSLGGGVAASLQNVINEKARKIEEKHEYERNLQFLKGLGVQNAEQLSYGTPEQITQFLKNQGGATQGLSPEFEQAYGSEYGPEQEEMPIERMAQESPEQLMQNPENRQAMQMAIENPEEAGFDPEDIPYAQKLLDITQPGLKQQLMQPKQSQGAPYTPEPGANIPKQLMEQPATKKQPNINNLIKAAKNPADFKKIQLQTAAQNAEEAKRTEAYKLTEADRKELRNKSNTAKETLRDLERLEELQKEGKLDTPGYVEFLNRSGLDIPSLLKEGSQEFNKIVNNFTRNAKSIFGARISNFEIEQYLKTLPNLSQSPEGRKRVIANLKRIAKAEVEYYNTSKDIIKHNKNIPPLDLLDQVDERMDDKLDMISEEFREDLKKPVPKGQEQLNTALQAIGGSVLGAPGKVLNAIGGTLGNVFGAKNH